MAYDIRFTRPALCQLRKLSRQERTRIEERITRFADDPRPSGSRVLRNTPHYRIRVGDYRAIYRIQDNELIVLIVRVGHRRDVMKGSTTSSAKRHAGLVSGGEQTPHRYTLYN